VWRPSRIDLVVNQLFSMLLYKLDLVHAPPGLRASSISPAGGRIPRIAWTRSTILMHRL
jgi:hypothetical protein